MGGVFKLAIAFLAGITLIVGADAARAFFVFGDSLVDNGNNNFLATTARADAYPYGIDSESHMASGRFSNGLNIPDIISEKLGSQPTLPYLNPLLDGENLLIGANFASAGVGILNDTGVQFMNIIRISRQMENFQQYQERLSNLVGPDEAQRIVKNAVVLITLGGNDFVNNYYLIPFSARSRQYEISDYVTYLISEYRKILSNLHDLGARRVLVTGTGPLGCVPGMLAMRGSTGDCDAELQQAAGMFNPQLVDLIKDLNSELGSDVFIAANAFNLHMTFISEPEKYGFETSKLACCGQGPFNGLGLCTIASNLCPDRSVYVFWDAFHPTERANRLIVDQMFSASTDFISPMNLSTALALDNSRV